MNYSESLSESSDYGQEVEDDESVSSVKPKGGLSNDWRLDCLKGLPFQPKLNKS